MEGSAKGCRHSRIAWSAGGVAAVRGPARCPAAGRIRFRWPASLAAGLDEDEIAAALGVLKRRVSRDGAWPGRALRCGCKPPDDG